MRLHGNVDAAAAAAALIHAVVISTPAIYGRLFHPVSFHPRTCD